MSRDDIVRMAVEAGGGTPEWDGIWELSEDALKRFYELAVAAEREACAKVCEDLATDLFSKGADEDAAIAEKCAASIWNRSET